MPEIGPEVILSRLSVIQCRYFYERGFAVSVSDSTRFPGNSGDLMSLTLVCSTFADGSIAHKGSDSILRRTEAYLRH